MYKELIKCIVRFSQFVDDLRRPFRQGLKISFIQLPGMVVGKVWGKTTPVKGREKEEENAWI